MKFFTSYFFGTGHSLTQDTVCSAAVEFLGVLEFHSDAQEISAMASCTECLLLSVLCIKFCLRSTMEKG